MIRYTFNENFVAMKNAKDADAQVLGEALQKIYEKYGDGFKPNHLVEEAKKRSSPFYRHFTWDIKKAAEERWLDQARGIIRCIRRIDDDTGEDAGRAFLSVNNKGIAYHSTTKVMTSREMQFAVLRQARADLKSFTIRYSQLRDICALVKVAEDRIESMMSDEDQPAV